LSRVHFVSGLASFALVLALCGCQKSTDQANPSDSASNSSPNGSSADSNSGSMSSGKSREARAERPLVVPAETLISVVLDEPLSSKSSATGQDFAATVSAPVEVDGRVAIPKGARAAGVVRDAKSAGRFKGAGELSVSLTSVTVGGKKYELQTSDHTQVIKGKGKRSAALIGGGGAAGALIVCVCGWCMV
jgi:cytoskeletal protein RodZ